MLTIKSPAKINLFLKVLRRREDGYHDIVSVMCLVGLFDHITLSFDTPTITVQCSEPRVPEDSANLAYRAADLFMKKCGISDGVEITIDKVIPVAAGLGGGSSNAASVLMGLNQRYDHRFTRDSLLSMALKLGADVPFFIFWSPAKATGLGNELTPLKGLPHFWVLLIYPKFEVPTAWVYENLKLTKSEINYKSFTSIKTISDLKQLLHNDLEQVTLQKYPRLETIKKELINVGAEGALMSGSGPTIFGIFDTLDKARIAYRSISHKGEWDVFLAEPLLNE
jgi:4-diphosphocytidyl-2-C-methyl-D-erythritol kinase